MTTARVTHEYVDVAYTDPTAIKARVTHEYVDVAYTEITAVQFDVAIVASGQYTANLTKRKALSAAFTSSALLTADLEFLIASESVISTLNLTQTVEVFINERVGSLLQLKQTVSRDTVLNLSVSNALSLAGSASQSKNFTAVAASNILTFTQQAVAFFELSATASSTLTLTQNVDYARPTISVLNLTHVAVGVIGGIPESLTSVLSLTQSVAAQLILEPSDVSNTLLLTQTVTVNMVGDQIASNQLFLTQLAVGTVLEDYVILESPYESPERTIVLPKPLVKDTENIVSDFNLKKSMNGVNRTYVKNNVNRRLTYTFSMKRKKSLELENFFWYHNSDSIKIRNWKGEIWRSYLITNPLDYNQPRRGPIVEIDLEFEGVKVSG